MKMSELKISTLNNLNGGEIREVESFCYKTVDQKENNEDVNSKGAVKTALHTVEAKTEFSQQIETLINSLLTEVGLKPNQRELVRACIAVSEANPYFQASFKDLAAIVYGQNAVENRAECKRATDKIRNNIKTLQNWQEANGLDIIQIVTLGNRIKTGDGQFKYNKTRFYFLLLDEILKSIPLDSAESFEVSVGIIIEKLKEQHQPVERRKPYHPNHKIQKAGKTLLTNLDNIFNWNIEAKSDPIKSCERFLEQLNERFKRLSSVWKEQQSREKAIVDFEGLMASCQEKRELSNNHNKESELPLEK